MQKEGILLSPGLAAVLALFFVSILGATLYSSHTHSLVALHQCAGLHSLGGGQHEEARPLPQYLADSIIAAFDGQGWLKWDGHHTPLPQSLELGERAWQASSNAAAAAPVQIQRRSQLAVAADSSVPSRSKWIVITSIAPPTMDVMSWALMEGWQLVVVGDKKSPSTWELSNAIFLSLADQETLGYSILKVLPQGNYARKMVGYLYAIQHGAELIYESDDDNAPLPGLGLNWIRPERTTARRTCEDLGVMNPYAHFNACTIWPRGYPLKEVFKSTTFCYPTCYDGPRPRLVNAPIQQGLADLDPDVDAIWRITRTPEIGTVRFSKAEALSYGRGTLAPYNTQNTVHFSSAFWALFIPASVNMRVCDIWRSYWAQRLLWEIDSELLFVGGTVEQLRNSHNYTKDFHDEMQMNVQSHMLVGFLTTWTCLHNVLELCALQLGYDMVLNKYWAPADVLLLEAFLVDLRSLGYSAPPISRPARYALGSADKDLDISKPLKGSFLNTELFLRLFAGKAHMAANILLPSLLHFWPQASPLVLVFDEESKMDHTMAPLLRSIFITKGALNVRVRLEPDNTYYHGAGHSRQQLSMFWADNFTDAAYVGFLDTDTVFVTPVLESDLFTDGKPVIQGWYGMPDNSWWAQVPKTTKRALGKPEVMRCMSYFPFIIRTSHLSEMRQYMSKLHGMPFNKVFEELSSQGPYSQFNVMCNYLWYYHKDEYSWHVEERQHGWSGSNPPPPEGQIAHADFLPSMTPAILRPKPRVAIHFGYISDPKDLRTVKRYIREGQAFAQKSLAGATKGGNIKLHENLFRFEFSSWNWDPRCNVSQAEHYAEVQSEAWVWDEGVLAWLTKDNNGSFVTDCAGDFLGPEAHLNHLKLCPWMH